jgi:hypothetical protein
LFLQAAWLIAEVGQHIMKGAHVHAHLAAAATKPMVFILILILLGQ